MKRFDIWNEIKKAVEEKARGRFSEGDIWMANLGENIGVEEVGKGDQFLRPIIVIKKFNSEFGIGIPLSTTDKEGVHYFKFQFQQKTSNALLSQIKSIDAKRFKYRIGRVGKQVLEDIKTKARNLIF